MSLHPHLNPQDLGDFILVGDVGSGKSTLLKALLQLEAPVTKTQALAFHHNNIIDSPGEFASRRYLYGALLNTISRVGTIVYLQPAGSPQLCLPVDLLRLYPHKQLVGVISKIDEPGADPAAAEALLAREGVPGPYFPIAQSDLPAIRRLGIHLAQLHQQQCATLKPVGASP